MTTAQIIILVALVVITMVSYFGVNCTKSDNKRVMFSVFWLFASALLFLTATITLSDNLELKSKIKGKCPEYEKVENVYKLKQ